MLKELLKRDFGFNLDISGGTGQSREDPITILSNTLQDALHTEYLVFRGIGKGRGIFWRTISAEYVDGIQIIQRKIETKDVRKTEIIRQIENYYFSRPNIEYNMRELDSQCVIFSDLANGIVFPYELSWLHCDGVADYIAKGRADLGKSILYNAPGIKVTIYIYPLVSCDSNQETLELELDAAIEEIKLLYGSDAIGHDWGIQKKFNHICYYFIPNFAPNDISLILIASKGDCFIKLRCSFVDEVFMREICSDFVTSFVSHIL